VNPIALGVFWRAAMLIVGLAAAVPTRLADLQPHPMAVRDFSDALARARRQQAVDDSIAAPGGRTILLTHGQRVPRAVVLLHGFTDSPRQFAALADSFYVQGDNVYVPRLPHHAERGADARHLARVTAEELRASADSAVDIANGLGDSVVVIGLSAGGTIAAWVAQNRQDVQRLVIIAPAFEVGHVPSILERPLVNLSSRAPNVTRRSAADSSRPDLEPGVATRGVAQVLRLGIATRRAADERPPKAGEMIFLLNAHDHTVKSAPALDLAARWRSSGAAVAVYEFPDSLRLPHNVMEAAHHGGNDSAVYPTLDALAHGERPPGWAAGIRPFR